MKLKNGKPNKAPRNNPVIAPKQHAYGKPKAKGNESFQAPGGKSRDLESLSQKYIKALNDQEGPCLEVKGESSVSDLQAAVYQSGQRTLSVLLKAGLAEQEDVAPASKALDELGRFFYNIGFAGEQSSGKSMVINSLLQYPIMPTCKRPTTATVVRMSYSEHYRVRAFDDDTRKIVMDFDCETPSDQAARESFSAQFSKLLDYSVAAMKELIIENFQYFSDVNVFDDSVTARDIDISMEDPRQIMLLMLVLLSVYVGQNSEQWTEELAALMKQRRALFGCFGIPSDVVNLSVFCQAPFEALKSGLIIMDLPGLGSNVDTVESHGKKVKGHDEITKEAIIDTDAMVFLTTPENRVSGYKVLPEVLSSAKLKEIVYKGDWIIPVLNQADRCKGHALLETTVANFCSTLSTRGIVKNSEDIIRYSGIYGEYMYPDFAFERTLYYNQNLDRFNAFYEIELSHGEDEETARAKVIERMRNELKKKYEESGIEQLKLFFRSNFIETGKYQKSTAALHAMRSTFDGIKELEQRIDARRIMKDGQAALRKKIVDSLSNAVKTPLSEINNAQTNKLDTISDQIQAKLKQDYLDEEIPKSYFQAFDTALADYKRRMERIINSFDLFALLGNSARIDVPGSANRSRYLNLLEEAKRLTVSLTSVNQMYEKALSYVSGEIDGFYNDTIQSLTKLVFEIRKELDQAKSRGTDTPGENAMMAKLADRLGDYLDKQIQLISQNLQFQQQKSTTAQQKVLQDINTLNSTMVTSYTASIAGKVNNGIKSGKLFAERDYLIIYGENGMRELVRALALTDAEKTIIKDNLDAGINAFITTTIPMWVNDLWGIIDVYNQIEKKAEGLFNDVIKSISESESESAEVLIELNKKLEAWKKAASDYKREVQSFIERAFRDMRDKEPLNEKLAEDVLYGCFAEGVVL